MKQTNQLNLKFNDDTRQVFDQIEKETGIKDHALCKALILALSKYWKKHKRINLPFEITMDQSAWEAEATENGIKANFKKK